MSIHNDLADFLLSRVSVIHPICTALSLPETVPASDQRIKQRVCYIQAGSDMGTLPYFVFDGPYAYDPGNVSEGAVGQKIANFWFVAYHSDIVKALDWITAFEIELRELFVPTVFVDLPSCRITSMICINGSKRPMKSDRVQQTGREFSNAAATISYQIGYQE